MEVRKSGLNIEERRNQSLQEVCALSLSTSEALARHFNDVFRSEYLSYEDYLYDDLISDFLICPLQNFICSRKIEMENHLGIRRIAQKEFHSLVEAEKRHGLELGSYPEFVLYVPVDKKDWREHVEKTITSLRLLKKERVGLDRIYRAYAFPFRPWEIMEPSVGTKFVERSAGVLFKLTSEEEKELNELLRLLYRAKAAGYLTVSIRRFNFAFEREMLEDSWIDLFVSLESLFSKSSEVTEVTHRLATRISRALISGSLYDKKQFRKKIKAWYNIRSRIVHGLEVSLSETQLEDLGENLRKAIKWFLTHKEYADHDKIIDLLDLGS